MEEQLKNLRKIMNETALKNITFDERNKQNVWRAVSESNDHHHTLPNKRWMKQGLTLVYSICFFLVFAFFTVSQIDVPFDKAAKQYNPDDQIPSAADGPPDSKTDDDSVEENEEFTSISVIGLDEAKKIIPFKIELPPESVIPEELKQEILTTADSRGERGLVRTLYGKNGGKHIEIIQINDPEKSDVIESEEYQKIEISGAEAWAYSSPNDIHNQILLWRDNQHFHLRAVDVPLDQLTRAAEALSPLPYYEQIAAIGESLKNELAKHDTEATVSATEQGIVELRIPSKDEFIYYVDIDPASYLERETTFMIDDIPYAGVNFIIDRDSDYYSANIAKASELSSRFGKQLPPIRQGIHITNNSVRHEYNEDLTVASVLIEIGGANSSPAEIDRTVKVLAEVLAKVNPIDLN